MSINLLGKEIRLGASFPGANQNMIEQFLEAGIEYAEVSYYIGFRAELDWRKTMAFGKTLRKKLVDGGMKLWSMHAPFGIYWDLSEVDETKRRAVVTNLIPFLYEAAEYGMGTVVIHASAEPITDEERPAKLAACARSYDELRAVADPLGVRIACENLPRTCLSHTSDETLMLAQHAGGICLDINHVILQTHKEVIDAEAPFVYTTHLSDSDGVDDRHWQPGTEAGIVPWNYLFHKLNEAGYSEKAVWTFELGCSDPATLVADFRRCVEESVHE